MIMIMTMIIFSWSNIAVLNSEESISDPPFPFWSLMCNWFGRSRVLRFNEAVMNTTSFFVSLLFNFAFSSLFFNQIAKDAWFWNSVGFVRCVVFLKFVYLVSLIVSFSGVFGMRFWGTIFGVMSILLCTFFCVIALHFLVIFMYFSLSRCLLSSPCTQCPRLDHGKTIACFYF